MKPRHPVQEPARSIHAGGAYDVIVAGGGLGGTAAAIAAARAGAKTLLVERNAFLGGTATAGMCCSIFNCFYTADHRPGPTGIPVEIADALAAATGYGKAWHRHKGHVIYDLEAAKRVLEQQVREAGSDILFNAWCAEAIHQNDTVTGIVVETKAGRQALPAHTVVDATGDADIAARAGARLEHGNSEPGYPHSLCFRLGNVDVDRFVRYFREHPDQYPEYMDVDWNLAEALAQYEECGTLLFPHGGGMQMNAFRNARAAGDLPPKIGIHDTTDACQMHLLRQTGIAHIVTGFVHFDGLDPRTTAQALIDGREMCARLAEVYRQYLPGFERAFVAGTAANLGVRFSRRIAGRALLTRADARPGSRCPDAVGRAVAYEHRVKHPGKNAWSAQVMSPGTFQIPLGCLLPETLDGLIMGAGRSAATTEYWLLRVMVTTMIVGQAAGTAAAVAARENRPVADTPIPAIQEELRCQGVELDCADDAS